MRKFYRLPPWACRLAVVLMYGAYAAGTVLQWQQNGAAAPQPLRSIILALFALALLMGSFLSVTYYWHWGTVKDTELDEREIATRNAAYVHAYRIIAVLSMAGSLWWISGPLLRQPAPLGVDANVLFWGYVLLLVTLPTALLAWKDRAAPA